MNFFKKVLTFFSAIWNAILWRKTDKKPKQVSKSVKEEDKAEGDTSLNTPETEKLFVDIPLHSSEADNLPEKEFLVHDESPPISAPIFACNIESPLDDGLGTNKCSPGIQRCGLGEEICRSLSFFSEPVRDDKETESPFIPSITENEVELEQSAINTDEQIDSRVENDEQHVNRPDDESGDELPTPPCDPISEEILGGRKEHPIPVSPGNKSTNPDLIDNLVAKKIGKLDKIVVDDIDVSTGCVKSFTDHLCVVPKSEINIDLGLFAAGDEIHLFFHDDIADDLPDENRQNGTTQVVQQLETDEQVESEEAKPRLSICLESVKGDIIEDEDTDTPMIHASRYESIIHLGTADNPDNTESAQRFEDNGTNATGQSVKDSLEKFNHDAVFSEDAHATGNPLFPTSDVGPIGASVSTIQTITHAEATDFNIEYSTNYMVKSDSLVNFLPEGESNPEDIDITHLTNALLEAARKPMPQKDLKDNSVLKEGCMEEVMCTPRGILKLAGDHSVDPSDEEDPIDIEKTAANFMDTFLDDQQDNTPECFIAQGSPTIQEILETDVLGFSPNETVEGSEKLHPNDIKTSAVSRSTSITQVGPNVIGNDISDRSWEEWQSNSLKINHDKNKEDRNDQCTFLQFTSSIHSDEDAEEPLNRPVFDILRMPALRIGESHIGTDSSDSKPPEKDTSPTRQIREGGSNSPERAVADLAKGPGLSDDEPGWRIILPHAESEEINENRELSSNTSLQFLNTLQRHENSCDINEEPHLQIIEDKKDFNPFVDCSSFLFRIPEEIRKETSFNPCVGAAPSSSPGCTYNNDCFELARFDAERDDRYEAKYPNVNSLVPKCVGALPLINPCMPEEYVNSGYTKPEGCDYNVTTVSLDGDPFWESNTGIAQYPQDQHNSIVGYPLSCDGSYYEHEYVDGTPAVEYENNRTNVCTDPEGYSCLNPYGTVGYPVLNMNIPFCPSHSPSPFMHREHLPPMIFPIGAQIGNVPSIMSAESAPLNEQYLLTHRLWGGYPTSLQLQNDEDEEKEENHSAFEVQGLISMQNASIGTNDDDDGSNPIPDSYSHLAENNSLHTVKSKADSYSGSLFCESLRSLISHNTENENIFPSFSCSSVQGCCPSVRMQSCGTTLSNDSLSSISVEGTKQSSKSADEDHLATEKFMNDVNTALNESVWDQIPGQVDIPSNLLGRGDGSMAMPEHEDYMETTENDVMMRNSLGENISINNSKLTLLDGVLRTESGGSLSNRAQKNSVSRRSSDGSLLGLTQNVLHDIDGDTANGSDQYCQQVLNLIVDNMLDTLQTTAERDIEEPSDINAECSENSDESLLRRSPEREFIVQNVMLIEEVTDGAREVLSDILKDVKQTSQDDHLEIVSQKEVGAEFEVPNDSMGLEMKNSSDRTAENSQVATAEDLPNVPGHPKRRRRKKQFNVESEEGKDISASTIGDCIRAPETEVTEIDHNFKNRQRETSKSEVTLKETSSSLPLGDGEMISGKGNTEKSEENVAQVNNESGVHQEDEEDVAGESSGNPPGNKKRRNRRRKRKN